MAHHGQHLANYHVLDLRVHPLVGLHLLAEDGEGFHKFLVGYMGKINEVLVEPFSVEFHCFYLLRTGSGTECRCRRSDAGR